MKKLLILSLLFFSACTVESKIDIKSTPVERKFKVGDCFKEAPDPKAETWEEAIHHAFIWQVLEIGKAHYRTRAYLKEAGGWFASNPGLSIDFYIEDVYTKTECPKE